MFECHLENVKELLRIVRCETTLSDIEIKDPAAFRALAHPLRLELFERLAILGTATASQLAEYFDESPANCSFHLRQLAKFGYIERDESSDGRERPWRVLDITQHWDPANPDPSLRTPSEAFEDALHTWDEMRLRQARRSHAPEGFAGTMVSNRSTLWLTPGEARELSAQINALMQPYIDRWETNERPEGGRPMRLIAEMYAVADRTEP